MRGVATKGADMAKRKIALAASRVALACAMAVLLLNGCASSTIGCRQGAQICPAIGTPNSETDNGTSCAVVVQNSHVCTYDGEGRFKGDKVKPGSGVCICLGFDS